MTAKVVVKFRVTAKYQNTLFIHCYAHQRNLIVEHCVTENKQVYLIFLAVWMGFQSSKRTAFLDEILKKIIYFVLSPSGGP